MPEISVIIPTWNRAKTLGAAIESILAQTLPPLEILICDDGSTDESRLLVEKFTKRDSRVRWVEGLRGGRPAIPRNRGIKESRSEWLAFMDSDDEWLPEKLARQWEAIRNHKTLAACTNALRRTPEGEESRMLPDLSSSVFHFEDLIWDNKVVCSSALFHRSLLAKVRGFPESEKMKAIEDYALWLRIASQTAFACVGEPLVRYYDDAHNSVREGQSIASALQRRRIYLNFIGWGLRPSSGLKYSYFLLALYRFTRILMAPLRARLTQVSR